jgi:hypothetical protein
LTLRQVPVRLIVSGSGVGCQQAAGWNVVPCQHWAEVAARPVLVHVVEEGHD